jgi:nucleotide-binding universal stress UspA family protein
LGEDEEMSKLSIMCAIDFTSACDEALRVAVEEAERRDAILDIVHVWFPSDMVAVDMSGIGTAVTDPELPEHLQQQLDALHVPLSGQRVRRHLLQGNAADQITAKANELHSDLLVVGTHTRGAIARWFLGSVVTELLRMSPCPILVCRTPPSQPSDAGGENVETSAP